MTQTYCAPTPQAQPSVAAPVAKPAIPTVAPAAPITLNAANAATVAAPIVKPAAAVGTLSAPVSLTSAAAGTLSAPASFSTVAPAVIPVPCTGGGGGGPSDWVQGELTIQIETSGNNSLARLFDSAQVNNPIIGRQVSWSWDLTLSFGGGAIQTPPSQSVDSETSVLFFIENVTEQQPFFELSGTITATVDGYSVTRSVYFGSV
jgi:hypothetical protein